MKTKPLKTKLLRIIRANFNAAYVSHEDSFVFGKRIVRHGWIAIDKMSTERRAIVSDNSFDLIIKMLERIYPQGRHYAIMRHSRRFKQARRNESVRVVEIACIVGFVALIIIAILNSCCGSGDQY